MRKLCAAAGRVAAIVAVVAALGSLAASAQTSPDVQSILNAIAGQSSTSSTQAIPAQQIPSTTSAPTQTTIQPAAPPARQPQSQLEQLYSKRAGQALTQFGYDTFGVGSSVQVTQVGAMQDDYILGPGDQINVILRGHENTAYSVTVDRDGQLLLPDLPPIAAGGRTFGEVRREIERRIAKTQINSQAYISIGTVRQVAVLVTGEVASPGVRTLTGLNTPVDAILLSGGIQKTGTLRNVIVVRNGRRTRIDLYSMIATGARMHLGALTEGDRIIVPAIGKTVAVAGLVKRPGIYELEPGASGITERSLVRLAGGMELAGAKRLSKLELLPDGRTRMVPLSESSVIRAGEVLFVDFQRSASNGIVTLAGEVALPGTYSLASKPSISRMLRDNDDLTPQSYTLFGVIVRRNPKTNFQSILPFSIAQTFAGKEDIKLSENDLVYVFNQSEIAALAAAASAALSGVSSASNNPLATAGQQTPSGNSNSSSSGAPSSSSSSQTSSSLGQTSSGSTQPPGTNGSQSPPAGSATSAPALMGVPQSSAATVAAALQAANAPPPPSTTSPSSALPSTSAPVAGIGQAQATEGATGGAAATVATAKSGQTQVSLDQIAANLGVPTVELVNSARDYLVTISGEVRNPGSYLAVGGTSLASLVAAAGGLQREADMSSVEITSTLIDANTGTSRTVRNSFRLTKQDLASVALKPFDSVRLRPVFSDRNGETVSILGQVRYPGTFDITRGERLSSVLLRAGGLTDEAYPFGAVFTRQSAAIQEADGDRRTAQLLEDNIATVATLPSTISNPAGLSYVEQIAQQLRTMPALGRISVTVDPVILATKPQLDTLLENGDAVYIPKRPSTVTVTGDVLNNGSFVYKPGKSVDDYIDEAGGENSSADDSLVFVVLPDGSARPEGASWFSFGGGREIPPGSMIVVPRDPQPFNWTLFAINITDIVSKLATTAAALAVIGATRGGG